MPSYVLVTITFILGLVGTLFDLLQKDENDRVIRGVWDLPKLTAAGKVTLFFLTASFLAAVAATFQEDTSREKATAAAVQLQQDLTSTKRTLGETKRTLDDTKKNLEALEQKDLTHFEGIAKGLESTTDKVTARLEGTSQKISEEMRDSSDELDQNVRGSLAPIDHFAMNLFFKGIPQTKHEPASSTGSLVSLETVACNATVPLTLTLQLPLAESPSLFFIAHYETDTQTCSGRSDIEVISRYGMHDFGKRPADTPWVEPQLWSGYYYGGPCDLVAYNGQFDLRLPSGFSGEDFGGIPSRYKFTAASFRPEGGASITVEVSARAKWTMANSDDWAKEQASNKKIAMKYMLKNLPQVMGFSILPEEGHIAGLRRGLERGAAFSRDSVFSTGGLMEFRYEQTKLRPEWSFWRFRSNPINKELRQLLPNPYRGALPQADFSRSGDLVFWEHLGDSCKMSQ